MKVFGLIDSIHLDDGLRIAASQRAVVAVGKDRGFRRKRRTHKRKKRDAKRYLSEEKKLAGKRYSRSSPQEAM